MVENYRFQAEEKDLKLQVLINGIDEIFGGWEKLMLVLSILVSNAVKFSPQHHSDRSHEGVNRLALHG